MHVQNLSIFSYFNESSSTFISYCKNSYSQYIQNHENISSKLKHAKIPGTFSKELFCCSSIQAVARKKCKRIVSTC